MMVLLASIPLLFGSVTSSARATMDYEFTVCGVKHRFADRKIDWSFNPTYNNYREWPWQFARMRFLPNLATYYTETGDENAAKTFVDIVSSFIDNVPPPPPGTRHGATKSWRTLDTGLRATSWINSYFQFTNSPALTPEFRAKFRRSLDDHVQRLEKPLTFNNWRIMELRGLVDLLLAFPDIERADEIRIGAEKEFADILKKQLYPDGFHFELSTGYHGILDGDFSRLAMRYRQFGRVPPAFLESGIELAFELYPHLTRPDRFLPKLNDSGSVPIAKKMATASRLFPNRRDFLWFATDGKEGEAPSYLSYAFPYSGAVVFRSSWEKDAVWGYMDCSPFGRGHQHEDKLNFLLFAYGKEMLTEGGNYAYDTSEMRKYVISTRAHNTIRIDGKDQSARKFWKWSDDMLYKKADLTFETTPDYDKAVSTFPFGYGAAAKWDGKVKHTRTVEFIKNAPDGNPYFRITDELIATDDRERAYEQLWHLEKCKFTMSDDSFTADFGDGVTLNAVFRSDNGKLVDQIGTKEPRLQGWMPILPAGPHEHRPIHTPTLKGTFVKSAKIVVEFHPRRAK